MSDDSFKEARGSLAFSQSLRDRMTAEKMAQQSQMMPQEQMPEQEPEEHENNPQPEEKEEEPEESKIVQMFQTFMKEMRGLFQKDLQEDKKTEEKVDQLLEEEKKDEVKM
jgi:hypothetical protein